MASGQYKIAAQIIRQGGIIAYPTESCYGLGCDPFNYRAVSRLLQIKQRPISKGLILIASDLDQIRDLVLEIPKNVLATWPGPVTWLCPKSKAVPAWLCGSQPKIAVRITAHPIAKALCRSANSAIVSTSANPSNQKPCKSYREVYRRFNKKIDYVLPGQIGSLTRATPIYDAADNSVIRK